MVSPRSEEQRMTTLSVVDPPLRRLFTRLDFAPRPFQQSLSGLLGKWDALRAERHRAATGGDGRRASDRRLHFGQGGRRSPNYILRRDALGLEHLTGMAGGGGLLSAAPQPREAARLRRLFETVAAAGRAGACGILPVQSRAGADLVGASISRRRSRTSMAGSSGSSAGCELRPSLRALLTRRIPTPTRVQSCSRCRE